MIFVQILLDSSSMHRHTCVALFFGGKNRTASCLSNKPVSCANLGCQISAFVACQTKFLQRFNVVFSSKFEVYSLMNSTYLDACEILELNGDVRAHSRASSPSHKMLKWPAWFGKFPGNLKKKHFLNEKIRNFDWLLISVTPVIKKKTWSIQ